MCKPDLPEHYRRLCWSLLANLANQFLIQVNIEQHAKVHSTLQLIHKISLLHFSELSCPPGFRIYVKQVPQELWICLPTICRVIYMNFRKHIWSFMRFNQSDKIPNSPKIKSKSTVKRSSFNPTRVSAKSGNWVTYPTPEFIFFVSVKKASKGTFSNS